MNRLTLLDALRIGQIDADYRRPIPATAYGCAHRCHSRRHTDRLSVDARSAHLFGVSWTAQQVADLRAAADAAMLPKENAR